MEGGSGGREWSAGDIGGGEGWARWKRGGVKFGECKGDMRGR